VNVGQRPTSELELELTFLPRSVPSQLGSRTATRVVDYYFPADPAIHPRLRIRAADDTYSLTKKMPVEGADSSAHLESTIPLTTLEFDDLTRSWSRIVEKDRFAITIDGYPCEVDVFRGSLSGLILLDFEFESEVAKNAFQVPTICLADVTNEPAIAGGKLAGLSYSDIAATLAHYGYHSLKEG